MDKCEICKVDKGDHVTGCPNEKTGDLSGTLNSLVRYDLVGCYDLYMDERSDGDYVKFDDVEKILSNDLNHLTEKDKEL